VEANASNRRTEAIARGLGWFSVALGVTQIVAPRRLSRLIGIDDRPLLMRMLGIRETLAGVTILAQRRPVSGLWSRVAGDGMDLALLGAGLASRNSEKAKLLGATAAVAGVTALDAWAGIQLTKYAAGREVKSAITVNRPLEEVYSFWSETDKVKHLMRSEGLSPQIVSRIMNERIEWQLVDGMRVDSASVSFRRATGRDGTEVRMIIHGAVPAAFLHEFLRRSKRLIETGEIPTTEGQPAGPSSSAVVSRLVRRFEGRGVA
jgi:uncharacterized membrane protein